MAKASPSRSESAEPDQLKSWKAIAEFLGQPVNVVQRWSRTGMPVERSGRYVTASRLQLSSWLGRASGVAAPVHVVAADENDLTAELRSGLSAVRKERSAKSTRRQHKVH